jgi:FAD:protein FMN transferase
MRKSFLLLLPFCFWLKSNICPDSGLLSPLSLKMEKFSQNPGPVAPRTDKKTQTSAVKVKNPIENIAAHRLEKLMGVRFEITAITTDSAIAWQGVEAAVSEINRIEKLISSWDSLSQTSAINRMAGIQPIKVSQELFALIRRSLKISRLTQGAFDISYASMDKIWQFDGTMTALPAPEQVAASVAKVGYQNIVLDEKDTTVFLKLTGMKIGFGAIGKGYAANRAKAVMVNLGIENGLVDAGGDLLCWGHQENGQPWQIGIADPAEKTNIFSWLQAGDMAVVTSGNYEKFSMIEGRRYAHIIDPRTGYPVQGIQSVTIVCPDAELADGLATAVFVMGEKEGLHLINQLKGIECLIVNDKNELIASDSLALNFYQQHH